MTVDRRVPTSSRPESIVLWELFTGQRFPVQSGGRKPRQLFKVVAADVPPIRNFEPSVPPEVEVVVRRALAAHPQDRFESAADFAEALEQAARTYNLVATVRTAAAFVNEMIGMDISQQREIVRAWLGRSDVSRSGVARTPSAFEAPTFEAPTPIVGTPSASPPAVAAPQLSSLVDDDLGNGDAHRRAARRRRRRRDARIQADHRARAGSSQPLLSMGKARENYVSVATSREFQPVGAQAGASGPNPAFANPALANTLSAPTSTAFTPPG